MFVLLGLVCMLIDDDIRGKNKNVLELPDINN